jgi:hypothetical protein
VGTPPQMEFRRHFHTLSDKDAETVVQTVADLIIGYLKRNPGVGGPAPAQSGTEIQNPDDLQKETQA